ncbi:MAG: hypothetical protein AAGD13_09700 [Pseudomonadota bacterium]
MNSFGLAAFLTVSTLMTSTALAQEAPVVVPIAKPTFASTEAIGKRGTALVPFLAKKRSRGAKSSPKRGIGLTIPQAS